MPTSAPTATEELLLEAAGEVFADRGFRAATIREICRRAGQANVAAVNYHFGSKENLYAAVLRYAHGRTAEQANGSGIPKGTPSQRLEGFVRNFLHRLLDLSRPAWHHKIVVREMIEPSNVLDPLVEEVCRPHFEMLREIVADLLPSNAQAEQVRLCVNSVLGQCLFYRHAQAILTRMQPDQHFGSVDIDRLAEHVTAFSLAALAPANGSPARDRAAASAIGGSAIAIPRGGRKGGAR